MPQLNPAPWFMIMCATWTVLIAILMPKMLALYYTTPPTQPESTKTGLPWTWPWC